MLSMVFFMMLLMMVQTSLVSLQQHLLDNATTTAIRSIVLGTVQSSNTLTASDFKTKFVCPNLMGLFDCSRVIVEARVTDDGANFDPAAWASSTPSDAGTIPYCVGAAGEYAFLRIAYPAPLVAAGVMPSSVFDTYKGDTVVMLQSFGALRVEPVGVKRVGAC